MAYLRLFILVVFLCCLSTQADQLNPSKLSLKAAESMILDVTQVAGALVAVGERGHVLRSVDSGLTWVQVQSPVDTMLTAVFFVGNTGWAVGHDGHIIKSSDGGLSWVLVRNGLDEQKKHNKRQWVLAQRQLNMLAKQAKEDASLAQAYERAQDDFEWLSEKRSGIVIHPPLMDVRFLNDKLGFAVGGFGVLLTTDDGGVSWKYISDRVNNEQQAHYYAIVIDDDRLMIAGEMGFVSISDDNGVSWENISYGFDGSIFTASLNHVNGSYIASGIRGLTKISTDRGVTWSQLAINPGFSLTGSAFSKKGKVALVGSGGTIAVSDNDGGSFFVDTLPSRALLSSVVFVDEDTLVIAGQDGLKRIDLQAAIKNK